MPKLRTTEQGLAGRSCWHGDIFSDLVRGVPTGGCRKGCRKAEPRACTSESRTKGTLRGNLEDDLSPLVRATNANHPALNQDLLEKVLPWRPSGNGKGIGLTGPTCGCKTRTMSLLLRDLHLSGVQVRWVNAIELSRASSEVFDEHRGAEAKNVLRNAAHAEVLFIDDIGKERFTDRAELELYSLIETRVAHLGPILWTSKACGKELREMMSGNRGPAITRRLAEFSSVYRLPYKRAEPIEQLATHVLAGSA